jgi:hypothetical protein
LILRRKTEFLFSLIQIFLLETVEMEGNCSQGRFDSQVSSMRDLRPNAINQNQKQHHPNSRQDSGFNNTMDTRHNNVDRGKKSMSEDDELCLLSSDGQNKSKENSPWQRVKWMDKMVKLMITALSYIGEDSGSDKKFAVLQKKGKWRSVSKVMDERGYHVSPQQCEDKFNDLNKRYKKLNEMLGRGTSCEVVENPSLLDKIDYLNEKEKDEVRRIMSSKHLFYEEMCSYHNGNRLHLPHDPAVQRSLHLITLGSRDDHDNDEHGKHQNEDLDDDDDYEEDHDGALSDRPLKRLRQSQSHEDVGHPNKGYDVPCLPRSQADVTRGISLDSRKAAGLQRQQIESKSLELEGRKLQIQAEMMELERQQFKWEVFSKRREQKLAKMRMENERMKLENERMSLELKRIELGAKL